MITVKIYLGISLGIVGSVQCQIIPCSGLYLFSRSIGAPQMSPVLNAGFQSVVTCYFQSGPPFFVYFGFLCKSLQCLISALTQGGEGGHLLRLTCSVVLWRGRDTANKHRWRVWGVLAVDGPHWVCHSPRQHVLPGSRLISLQGALQGHCAKWALRFMHFPGLSRSGSQVLHKGTDPDRLCVLCPSQVRAAQATGCSVGHASNSPAWSPPLSFHKSAVPGVPYVSSGELIPGCDTPGRCQPSRIPRRRG